MMDPYNLAICFGPTLVPIPEDKDQVSRIFILCSKKVNVKFMCKNYTLNCGDDLSLSKVDFSSPLLPIFLLIANLVYKNELYFIKLNRI